MKQLFLCFIWFLRINFRIIGNFFINLSEKFNFVFIKYKRERNLNDMTRAEFEILPFRTKWDSEEELFDSLIILPGRDIHDSGYRCMDFVGIRDGKPICRLTGCSDVVHIEGIGGFGYKWLEKYGKCPEKVDVVGWNFDCLRKSGLLRMFSGSHQVKVGCALSSFDVYSIPTEKELERRERVKRKRVFDNNEPFN